MIFNPENLKSTLTMTKRHYAMVSGNRTLKFSHKLSIPNKYRFNNIPKNINFKNILGSYSAHYKTSDNELIKNTEIIFNNNTYYYVWT